MVASVSLNLLWRSGLKREISGSMKDEGMDINHFPPIHVAAVLYCAIISSSSFYMMEVAALYIYFLSCVLHTVLCMYIYMLLLALN